MTAAFLEAAEIIGWLVLLIVLAIAALCICLHWINKKADQVAEDCAGGLMSTPEREADFPPARYRPRG